MSPGAYHDLVLWGFVSNCSMHVIRLLRFEYSKSCATAGTFSEVDDLIAVMRSRSNGDAIPIDLT